VIRRSARKDLPPDSRLRFDPQGLRLGEFSRDFLRGDTVSVARELVGSWVARRYLNEWYGARIVETEAYLGISDAAAHSWRGRRTPRVEPMYQDGGHLYVFLVYGMHHCANVVTRPVGVPEAVLLRAAEGREPAPTSLLSGPGRLCVGLGITVAWSGLDLLSVSDLRLFKNHGKHPEVGVGRRVGIDYAGEAKDWPLRFFDLNSAAVSRSVRARTKQRYRKSGPPSK